ncbi:hypothetical protein D0469_07980 [Peribacillus saganii]|uniref:L,D-TPase catalytic domain-containing protein n=2 Tax=Peribacillus saganii TaxID=2303992 RepID=A0A372LPY4_9BACI|nr:hypothetical protein D0469_07980 [Peribacillus saganii]
MDAVLGYNGFSSAKREGDGATPAGIYKLGTVFGTGVKPPGVKMYYKRAGKYDYWVDDPASPDYNKWVTYSGDPKRKWRSFERMNQPLYKYGMVIEYNRNPIIKNKGSAIFLHTWKGPASKTAGCVALSETNLITLLKWFDPKQQPAIVMGTYSQLKTIQ